jgi:hypothetical protein
MKGRFRVFMGLFLALSERTLGRPRRALNFRYRLVTSASNRRPTD